MAEETKNSTLEKCTHQQKWLVEQLMYNLKNDEVLWQQGWITRGAPESAITGKKYRGSNNFLLTIVAYKRGYRDNRWLTHHQMEEHGWKFKTDAEGKSLGKGAGVPVEFYTLHDRKTKKAFEKSTLFGMNEEEQQEYMKENVFPIRRSYYVFNADLIDGIPELEKHEIDPNERVARADRFLQMWSEKEVPIIHGGSMAYYSPSKDEIHLPPMNDFLSLQDYYSTAFHETGHSTGHQSRLNRKLDNKFGTPEYAEEELRAEIASMFLGQEFGVSADTNAIRNNSAYVKAWIEKMEEDPSVLFKAIADANNIMKYIVAKEQEFNAVKEVEEDINVEDIQSQQSDEYMLPSEYVARNTAFASASEMKNRGIETLMRMDDRDVVEKARKISGEKFSQLYNGLSILGSEAKDEYSLMARLAMFVNGDRTQLMRVFQSSRQYRENKAKEYYETMADEALEFIADVKSKKTNSIPLREKNARFVQGKVK